MNVDGGKRKDGRKGGLMRKGGRKIYILYIDLDSDRGGAGRGEP